MALHNSGIGVWRHDNSPYGLVVMSPSANLPRCVMPIWTHALAFSLYYDLKDAAIYKPSNISVCSNGWHCNCRWATASKNRISENVLNSCGARSTYVSEACDPHDAEQHQGLVKFICFAYYVFHIPYFISLSFTDTTTYVTVKGVRVHLC